MIRVGPAGWDYKDWRGIVYPKPPPRGFDPLAYLAAFFGVVEVNSTFYRPMPGSLARGWCERIKANPDFRFTVKIWKRLTHEREAFGAEEVRQARELPDSLAEEGRLGAVLLQFPWSFKRDDANREWLRDVIAALAALPLVVEVRHASWNVPEVFEGLASRGVGFVNIDQPLFRHSLRPSAVATSPTGYIRVHGRNFRDWFRAKAGRDERYDYLYSAAELEPWAERARELSERTGDVYVVTNNHFRGQAVANAAMLESMVAGKKVPAPKELVESYREALEPYVVPVEAPAATAAAGAPHGQGRLPV